MRRCWCGTDAVMRPPSWPGVWWPKDIEGTDAADAIKEWGEGAHKRLERQIQGAARYVVSTA